LDRLCATASRCVIAADRGFGFSDGVQKPVTEANFDRTFNVKVRGTPFTVQKALPLMRDGASIIMTGSIAGLKGFPAFSVYNASTAAVRSFAHAWTVDLKHRKIRVNVISPGTIDTGVFAGAPQEVKDQFVSLIPMGRSGQPDDIAKAALFLACEDSGLIAGIELFVDGGAAQI
jgi:NAD(P)-dependent dehydrogenase (short-subunit alcohol dehydrogenase family)